MHIVLLFQILILSTVLLRFATVTDLLTSVPPELVHSSIHSPQTSQIQLSPIREEASTGQYVREIP